MLTLPPTMRNNNTMDKNSYYTFTREQPKRARVRDAMRKDTPAQPCARDVEARGPPNFDACG